jgi:hypothetical protein
MVICQRLVLRTENFGKALRQDLLAKGLSGNDFHQELFDMR